MKKFIVLMGLILISTTSYAKTHTYDLSPKAKPKPIINNNYTTNNYSIYNQEFKNEYGAKLDAPYLVQLHENWFLGLEGGKEIISSNASEGWNANIKITWQGTLFSFDRN